MIGADQVFIHLLHGGHAAEHQRHFRLVPHPLQRPIGLFAFDGGVLNHLFYGGGQLGKLAAQQRLHHDHAQSLAVGVFEPAHTRLGGDIHVVVLDLAEIPAVVIVDDLLEGAVIVMEGKAEALDLAGFLHALRPFQHSQLASFFSNCCG